MKFEITAKRLREAMNDIGIKQRELSNKANVAEPSISHYYNGTHAPSNISAGKMAEVLGVSPLWLMGFDSPKYPEPTNLTKCIRIPVLGMVAAGNPIESIENIQDYVGIPSDWQGDYRGFKVHGDSMSPRICDGDIIIVRRQDDAESGDIVVALTDEGATVKKMIKHKEYITLQPFNPAYEPMIFEWGLKIWGKVVELRAKL